MNNISCTGVLYIILDYQNNVFLRKTRKKCVQRKSTLTTLKILFYLTSTTKKIFLKLF